MPPSAPTGSPENGAASRMTGWKEIAAYVGRSVRTVQRWEQEANLPVHRYPTRNGEAVYAIRAELDAWIRTGVGTDAAAASPLLEAPGDGTEPDDIPGAGNAVPLATRRWRATAWMAGVIVLVTATVALAAWWRLSSSDTQPAAVRLTDDRLYVSNASGGLLWMTELDYEPSGSDGDYVEFELKHAPRHRRLLRDVDGDGRREVLLLTSAPDSSRSDATCWDARGVRLWTHRPDRAARFGEGPMGPPWIVLFAMVAPISRGDHPSLWLSWASRPEFGGLVERVDARTGRTLAEYWSAGYVTALTTGRLGDRPVVFLAGYNNENHGASLAVYDAATTAGAAPAANPHYACLDCPPGRPLAFFVFPKTSLGREFHPDPSPIAVDEVMQDAAGQVTIGVEQAVEREHDTATVLYRFDSRLRLLGAETTDSYRLMRRRLEREGRLPQRTSLADEARELLPVLRWEDGKFVPMTGPGQ